MEKKLTIVFIAICVLALGVCLWAYLRTPSEPEVTVDPGLTVVAAPEQTRAQRPPCFPDPEANYIPMPETENFALKRPIRAGEHTDVYVSAVFSDDSMVKEYSQDGTTWRVYTTAIRFSDNGTVWFRGADAAGNISAETSYTVGNIKKTAPDKPVATADITAPTNQNVTVSATFSGDSVVKEFSLDGKTWSAYTGGIRFAENGTVHFRGTDAAGNISTISRRVKIDRTAPQIALDGVESGGI